MASKRKTTPAKRLVNANDCEGIDLDDGERQQRSSVGEKPLGVKAIMELVSKHVECLLTDSERENFVRILIDDLMLMMNSIANNKLLPNEIGNEDENGNVDKQLADNELIDEEVNDIACNKASDALNLAKPKENADPVRSSAQKSKHFSIPRTIKNKFILFCFSESKRATSCSL